MQKINLQLFNGALKKVNPFAFDENFNKSASAVYQGASTYTGNAGNSKPNYGTVSADDKNTGANAIVKNMMNNGMGYDASRKAVENTYGLKNYQVTGNGAAPYNNRGTGLSLSGSVAGGNKDLNSLYSGIFGKLGGSGGTIGRIGGFQASQAYHDAMAYTNSLLEQLNSGRTSYSDKISEMMAKIEGRDKFSYDFNTDPLFQNALASAMQSGQTAMQDTIGQASALTGGYGSSYATSAANQAYNSYIQDAYSQLPQYYNLALQAYQNEGQELYNQLGMYQTADATEYDRLANAYNANLSNAQNIYNQEYSNYWDTANYNLGVDKFNAQQKADQQKMLYSMYSDAIKNSQKTTKSGGGSSDATGGESGALKSFLTATNNNDTLDMLKSYYLQGGSMKDETSEYSQALDALYLQGYDVDELDRWVRSQTITADKTETPWYYKGRALVNGGYYNVTYEDGRTERLSKSQIDKLRKEGVQIRIN